MDERYGPDWWQGWYTACAMIPAIKARSPRVLWAALMLPTAYDQMRDLTQITDEQRGFVDAYLAAFGS